MKIFVIALLFISHNSFATDSISFEGLSNIQMEQEKTIELKPGVYSDVLWIFRELLKISTNNITNGVDILNEPFMYKYMIIHQDLSFTVASRQASTFVYKPTYPYGNDDGYYWKKEFDYDQELENLRKIVLTLQKLETLDKEYYLTITDTALIEEHFREVLNYLEESNKIKENN